MCCAWKINRELAEITEVLDGILHNPVLTASALRRHWPPLSIWEAVPAFCCRAQIRVPAPQRVTGLSVPPFPLQGKGAGTSQLAGKRRFRSPSPAQLLPLPHRRAAIAGEGFRQLGEGAGDVQSGDREH